MCMCLFLAGCWTSTSTTDQDWLAAGLRYKMFSSHCIYRSCNDFLHSGMTFIRIGVTFIDSKMTPISHRVTFSVYTQAKHHIPCCLSNRVIVLGQCGQSIIKFTSYFTWKKPLVIFTIQNLSSFANVLTFVWAIPELVWLSKCLMNVL